MQVIASGCHWSKIKMKPIRAIAKTLGLAKSVRRGNALVSLLTTTYPKKAQETAKMDGRILSLVKKNPSRNLVKTKNYQEDTCFIVTVCNQEKPSFM